MKTTLEGSLLYERAEDGTQSLQFVGEKNEKGKVAFTLGSIATVISMVTHADWFCTRQFAPKVRITIEPLVEAQT